MTENIKGPRINNLGPNTSKYNSITKFYDLKKIYCLNAVLLVGICRTSNWFYIGCKELLKGVYVEKINNKLLIGN